MPFLGFLSSNSVQGRKHGTEPEALMPTKKTTHWIHRLHPLIISTTILLRERMPHFILALQRQCPVGWQLACILYQHITAVMNITTSGTGSLSHQPNKSALKTSINTATSYISETSKNQHITIII